MPSGASYSHQSVALDGETYSGCEFIRCRMIYSGGEPPSFEGCRFDACEWKFDDAAAQTLSYLRLIWGQGAKAAVQSVIKDITVAR